MGLRVSLASLAVTAVAFTVAACTSGNGVTQVVVPIATPTPIPIILNPTSLAFTVAGASATFNASESGYAGTFTASSTNCSGIATFAPASGQGPAVTFTVTSVAAGQCLIKVVDAGAQAVFLQVIVTSTSGTVQ